MNPFMKMYNFHRKEFGLEDNRFFQLFEKLLLESPNSAFECAPKIARTEIHAGRFRLGYEQKNNRKALQAIFLFLQRIEEFDDVRLNREILNRLVNESLDFSMIMKMGIGIDIRKNGNGSKVKYYLMIRGYPEMVHQVFSIHQPVSNIGDYPIDDIFGFGINMYFDGRTDIEIYPLFTPQDIEDTLLIDKLRLRKALSGFIDECHSLHISFDGHGRRILHFHPKIPSKFVQLLNNRRLSALYSNVKILNYLFSQSDEVEPLCVSFSLIEDEIVSSSIQNINLQYTLNRKAK